jgi:uncharacterized membrane protein YbhN (UPF0104 family)
MAATSDDSGEATPTSSGVPGGAGAPSDPGDGADPAQTDEQVEELETEIQPGRSLVKGLISLAILVAMVAGLLLAVPGLDGVADAVQHMSVGWLLIAVGLEILSCLGYVLAFLQVFDRAPIRFGARVALSELAFGAAVSLGGAGSIAVGAWLLVERGGEPTRVAERSAVLFLLTSAVNVLTLIVVGFALYFGLLPGPRDPLLTLAPALATTVVVVFFLLLPRFSERLAAGREPGKIRTLLIEVAASIRQTEQLLVTPDWRLIGAFAFLWCDIGVLAACFAAAGPVPPLAVIVLAYQIGYLSNLIPVPGNIGVLDGSLVGMFALFGVSATLATAATVVYHAIALWVPAMWGTVAFVILRRTRNRPLALRPPREERRRLRRLANRARGQAGDPRR